VKDWRRILLIRLGGIGDIIFTLPAVHRLRENFPEASISYLSSRAFAPLIKGFPRVDQILELDRGVYHQKDLGRIYRETRQLIRNLRNGHYELVIDFHGFAETAVMARLSGAGERYGRIRGRWRRACYTYGIADFEAEHPADQNLELIGKIGLTEYPISNHFQLPQEGRDEARRIVAGYQLDPEQPLLLIQPFTNFESKNWPISHYLDFASYWSGRGYQIIFSGGPADRRRLLEVAHRFPVYTGETGILTTAGLIEQSVLVVGGDTGIIHLATAMGKRVLAIVRSLDGFHPYQHPEWVLSPKRHHDFSEITSEEAIEAVRPFLTGATNGS
jgi:heptosyltransferase-1